MTRAGVHHGLPGVTMVVAVLAGALHAEGPVAPQRASSASLSLGAALSSGAVLDRYCVTCHNERLKTGGLVLKGVDPAHIEGNAEILEKVVRKLRVGAMPPAGAPRPDDATMRRVVSSIEADLDRAAALHPDPGRTETFHRLNRTEYANAIHDLLALDVDVGALIPGDESSFGFDNIAGVQQISPVFMERYAGAAEKISRLAVGSLNIPASESVFRLSSDVNQDDYVEGLPLGTRGGKLVRFDFPLDAEYEVRLELLRDGNDLIPRYNDPHSLEVTVDGERTHVFTFGEKRQPGQRGRAGGAGGRGNNADAVDVVDPLAASAIRDRDFITRVVVTAGVHDVGLAFIKKSSAYSLTQRQWFQRPVAGIGDTRYEPQLGSIVIAGPFNPSGPGDTPSRRRIFMCRPASRADESRCARQILSTLARRAYRRPVTEDDLQPLLTFFHDGRAADAGTFESGIELAVRRILVSPSFLFRVERDPARLAPDTAYRVSDVELASRLSFFLWSSIPDDQLLDVAARGKLTDPVVLRQQVRRMLADPRSAALVKNFAGQWLYLRNVTSLPKDGAVFPDFEGSLRQAFQRETELFFESILRDEHASVLELLTANYTFLNQRLAEYYGIPDVYGHNFRRVSVADAVRGGGLLSQGSILMATSYPTRTSPVIRGKWIMSNILGVPPPDPPPNVPALQEAAVGQAVAVTLSVRQRMEAHRADAACASCHKLMDPLGLALENFDAVGRWRTRNETGTPIDATGVLFDGSPVDGPASLRAALLKHPESIVRTVTEKLLTYALGRGVQYYDQPVIRKITKAAGDSNASLTSLITGIVSSVPFQMRRSQS
jgi:mono/diheme cytochrome c family protein